MAVNPPLQFYRVTLAGLYPNFTRSGDPHHRLVVSHSTREDAVAFFERRPEAILVERWEPQIGGWVSIGYCRDAPS
jgi:hypothetical protein